MCAGALWLTFWVFDVGVLMLIEKHPYDHLGMINLLTVVSVLLVTLCDLAIVIEEAKIRRATRGLTYTR